MKHLVFLTLIIYKSSYFAGNVDCLDIEYIIGGNLARPHQFKYQVSVRKNRRHVCGGAIIDDNLVITAAHCIVDVKTGTLMNKTFSVLVSSNNAHIRYEPSIEIGVLKIFWPRIYNFLNPTPDLPYRAEGDLAILQLFRGLGIAENARLNKLKILDQEFISVIDTLIVSGHGRNVVFVFMDQLSQEYIEIGDDDGRLRFGEANIINNQECNKIYYNPIHPSNLCAKMVQRNRIFPEGVCSGDSGSPLVYNNSILVGLVSANAIGCEEDEVPSVYTRISSFATFIKNVMQGLITSDMRVAVWARKSLFHVRYRFKET